MMRRHVQKLTGNPGGFRPVLNHVEGIVAAEHSCLILRSGGSFLSWPLSNVGYVA